MPQSNCTITLDQVKVRTYSYDEYMNLMESYAKLGVTSGSDQSQDKISATKLNFTRMTRLNKTITIDPELVGLVANLLSPQCWTVITEAWCGDSAQNLPALAKIAEASKGKINLQLVFRDDNPMFMNQYLTNGGQSIPKLVARNNTGSDLFSWGPRPTGASEIMQNWKMNPQGMAKSEILTKIHTWYNENKQRDLMQEIKSALLSIKNG